MVYSVKDDGDDLESIYDIAGGGPKGLVAVAQHVELITIAKAASEQTIIGVMVGIEHQLTRIGDSTNRPEAVITAEQAIDAWPLRIYTEHAIPYLEALGVPVEQEPR